MGHRDVVSQGREGVLCNGSKKIGNHCLRFYLKKDNHFKILKIWLLLLVIYIVVVVVVNVCKYRFPLMSL